MWLVNIFLKALFGGVLVTTKSGQLEGIREYLDPLTTFIAFRGIPYAEPPVGALRFQAPVPHHGWSGVRDASKHGCVCPSNDIMNLLVKYDEDCLFLNVYTADIKANRPVMVWIYGGGFNSGYGDDILYGPDYFIREDIVMVTLNYRLGTLGFLSTGDKYAQGNYGLKDIKLALEWVKQNIRNFGGDPDRVTIFGQSAGAGLIHNLLLSKARETLFHQAILMSGVAIVPLFFQPNPRAKAEVLAKNLGISFNSSEDMVAQLRSLDFKEMLKQERETSNQGDVLGPLDFAVTLEPSDSIEERIVTDVPKNILAGGDFRKVPTLIGTTGHEGIYFGKKTNKDSQLFERYNTRPEYFIPSYFNVSQDDTEIARKVRAFYFGNRSVSSETFDELAAYITDSSVKFPVVRTVKFLGNNSGHPIYYYSFIYDGTFNFIKHAQDIKSPGACHGDDLFYLFSSLLPMIPSLNDHAFVVRDRMVKMWSNFVKSGNPTPEINDLIKVRWPRYTPENEEYLEIGGELAVKNHFERMKFWYALQEYTKNTSDSFLDQHTAV